MRIVLLIAVTFITLSFYKQIEPDVILWSKDKMLAWNNFHGLPDTSNKYAAVTDCHIKMRFNTKKDTLYVSIFSYMQPSMSWVKIKSKNANLLKHEQVHFDITELYTRKLRQTVLSKKHTKSILANELKKIESNNHQEFVKCQDLYDIETEHSKIKLKQQEWEKKIIKELKELEAYSNTDLKILLK